MNTAVANASVEMIGLIFLRLPALENYYELLAS